jgi:hypothetical protein
MGTSYIPLSREKSELDKTNNINNRVTFLKTLTFHEYDDLQRKLSETVNYGPFSKTTGYTYYANGLKKSLGGIGVRFNLTP